MKFAVSSAQYKQVKKLQAIYDVTLISNKGLVFIDKDDWHRICGQINTMDEQLATTHIHCTLADNLNYWSECFIVAYDSSEDFSCHAVCNEDFFLMCCRRCGIYPVTMPIGYDLVNYIKEFDAHSHETLGCYIESRGDVLIEVEDN